MVAIDQHIGTSSFIGNQDVVDQDGVKERSFVCFEELHL